MDKRSTRSTDGRRSKGFRIRKIHAGVPISQQPSARIVKGPIGGDGGIQKGVRVDCFSSVDVDALHEKSLEWIAKYPKAFEVLGQT